MTVNRVLIDYTTLVSAANVIDCAAAVYPAGTANPYLSLLAGRSTAPESPMWHEVASLADLLECVVIHEALCILDVSPNDRNREVGRYAKGSRNGQQPVVALLREENILQEISVAEGREGQFQQWIGQAVDTGVLLERLVDSLFELLRQPAYATLPDLFSHSQTVYKFDGETIWSVIQGRVDRKELSRMFRRKARANSEVVRLAATPFFYPEDILGFFLRGLFYNEIAKSERIPYRPHAGRAPIVMSDGLWAAGVTRDYAEVPVDFVRRMRRDIATEVNTAAGCELFDLEIPPVLAAVLREAKQPEDCLPIAIQMRGSPAAKAYRSCLEVISRPESGREVLRLKADMEQLRQNLRKQLGLERQSTSVGLWKFSFPVKLPGWLFKSFYLPGSRHMQFIKDLALAVVDLQRLEDRMIAVFRRG